MSWAEVAPLKTEAGERRQAAVEFKVCKRSGPRKAQVQRIVTVIVRPKLAQGLPGWLKPGAGVKVLRGTGEHRGKLRITPGGPTAVGKNGGRYASSAIMIRIPLWDGLAEADRSAPVTFRSCSNAFEIDLPEWAVAS